MGVRPNCWFPAVSLPIEEFGITGAVPAEGWMPYYSTTLEGRKRDVCLRRLRGGRFILRSRGDSRSVRLTTSIRLWRGRKL
jgi:hypothetical protein